MMFSRLSCLPQGEVASGVFVVFVEIDAGTVVNAGEVFFGQLAVLGEAGNAEIPGAVRSLVSQIFGCQPLDQAHHLRDVFRGPGDHLRTFAPQCVQVLKEGLFIFAGVLRDGHTGSRRVADDLVVHIRNVHDLA